MVSRREISSSQRTWRKAGVAEFPGAGLGEAGLDGGEHSRQLQRAQRLVQGTGLDRGGHGDVILRFAVMGGGLPW